MNSLMRNKAQITIFIILGLIIIVIFALIFLLRAPPTVRTFDENEPQAYIESCIRETTEDAIEILSMHGGEIEPKGVVTYNDIDLAYLCYTNDYFEPCTNQGPLLVESIEDEITNYITPKIEACFQELRKNFENRYEVELDSQMELITKLQSKNVFVEIKRGLKVTRGGESRNFEDFQMHLSHPIYNFADISMQIVNQEIKFCNFDTVGYMFIYPEYDIKKTLTGGSDLIYEITNIATDQKFTFAVRGCLMPPSF